MANGLEERLATAGDDYYSYAALVASGGEMNVFELLQRAAELARISQMLDQRAAWTLATCDQTPATVAERVDAVLRFTEARMVKDE